MYPQSSDSQETDYRNIWERDLRNNPVTKNAIELKKALEFPNSGDDNTGPYLAGAQRIKINNSDKKIYILDAKEGKVIVIDHEGRYLGEMGRKGRAPGNSNTLPMSFSATIK